MNRDEFEKIILSAFAVNLQAYHSDIVHSPRQVPPFIASMNGLTDPFELHSSAAATFNRDNLVTLTDAYFEAREDIDLLIPYRFESCGGVRTAYIAGSHFDRPTRARKTKIHILLPVFVSAKRLKEDVRGARQDLGQYIGSMFHTVIQWLHVRLKREGTPYGLKPLKPGIRNCWLNLIFAANIDYHPGLTGSPSLYQFVATQLENYGYRNYLLQATTLLLLPLERRGKRALLFNEFGALVGGQFIDKDPQKLKPEALEREVARAIRECGWETVVAGRTNEADGGVDVIAFRDLGKNGRVLLAVQVKARGITAPDVRNLRGVLARDDLPLNAGIIVSNAAFTKDALWEAKRKGKTVGLYGNENLREFAEHLVTVNAPIEVFTEFPSQLQLTPQLTIELPFIQRAAFYDTD